VLKPKEIAEISLTLWYLPLDKLEEVKALVTRLRVQHGYKEPTDDSDEWTEEDRRDFTAESMKRFDEANPWQEDQGNAQAG
jgi:hypothetical protein